MGIPVLDIAWISLIKTITFVPRTLLIIMISLFGAEILVQLGVMRKLEPIGRPLARWAHLPPESAICFITAFGSVLAANAMIANFYRNQTINHKEMILSALFNSGPGYVREVFMFHIPIVMPLIGMQVAFVYLLTFGLTAMTNLFITIFCGRMLLPEREITPTGEKESFQPVKLAQALKNSWQHQKRICLRISLTFVVITFLVFFLTNLGVFKIVESWVAPLTLKVGLPAVVVAPLTAYVVSPLVGMATLGTLLHDGVITNYQGIITVLLGGILMLPVLAIRIRLPNNTAIFGFRFGLIITGITVSIAILIRILILVVFLLV